MTMLRLMPLRLSSDWFQPSWPGHPDEPPAGRRVEWALAQLDRRGSIVQLGLASYGPGLRALGN